MDQGIKSKESMEGRLSVSGLEKLMGGDVACITKDGRPVGVAMSIETYASYKAAFDLLQKTKIAYQAVKNHLDFLDGRSDGIDIDALLVDQGKEQ